MFNPDLLTHHMYHHGHYIIDDFLDIHQYQALRAHAQELHEQGLFTNARIGLKTQVQHNTAIRTDAIAWLDDATNNPAIHHYLEKTQQIAQILNHSLFLGLFEFETHFAVYQPGAYYKKHIDQFAGTQDRKISYVYYLNNEWHDELGGELKLYTPEHEPLKNISPQGNRFVCFNSELPHEVCTTHQTRYSITGWMKTRTLSPVVL